MKKILPFKAIAYNQQKISSMADVVTPPYDVISPEMQNEFYDRSPVNFCRLDYTKETGAARYEVAKKIYEQWLSETVLVEERVPAIYVHHQTFNLPDGRTVTRRGFYAARRIEDFSEGGIKPHEKTLEGPKADRLNLTRVTEANLSAVFSLYSDPDLSLQQSFARLTQTTPWLDFVTKEGERHELWRLTDAKACAYVDEVLSARPLFIADGHHRYETALNYRNEVMQKYGELPEDSAANFLLMYFANIHDPGMVILPIHRALHDLKNFDLQVFLQQLGEFFEIKKVQADACEKNLSELEELGKNHHAFWILTKDPNESYLVSLSRERWLTLPLSKEIPASLAKLDVSVLHHLIFNNVLKLSEESQAKQENIIYWKATQKAIDETRNGVCDVTFILNSTRIEDMQEVAMAGQKMPQKSTYFYPKIISGLVLHSVKAEQIDGIR